MEKQYTAGELAKLTGVSSRTIRFYDQKGLLKPIGYDENKYRLYDRESMIILQKIMMLKFIDFSLEEISVLLQQGSTESIQSSFECQKELLLRKRNHIDRVLATIDEASYHCDGEQVDLDKLTDIIRAITMNKSADKAFMMHEKHGKKGYGWFQWTFDQLNLQENATVLDIGCGYGMLWRRSFEKIPKGVKITLLDKPKTYIDDLTRFIEKNKETLTEGVEFTSIRIDAEQEDSFTDYYDKVLANHMLSFINDRIKLLKRIKAVLEENGEFYCTIGGSLYLKEMDKLLQGFDVSVYISEEIKNKEAQMSRLREELEEVFSTIEHIVYNDELAFDSVDEVYEYIISTDNNLEKELIKNRKQFNDFINKKIIDTGKIVIHTDTSLYRCK